MGFYDKDYVGMENIDFIDLGKKEQERKDILSQQIQNIKSSQTTYVDNAVKKLQANTSASGMSRVQEEQLKAMTAIQASQKATPLISQAMQSAYNDLLKLNSVAFEQKINYYDRVQKQRNLVAAENLQKQINDQKRKDAKNQQISNLITSGLTAVGTYLGTDRDTTAGKVGSGILGFTATLTGNYQLLKDTYDQNIVGSTGDYGKKFPVFNANTGHYDTVRYNRKTGVYDAVNATPNSTAATTTTSDSEENSQYSNSFNNSDDPIKDFNYDMQHLGE